MNREPGRKPNLLFVFADQLGRNHCGYAGAETARTPNLDRLARNGVDFRNAVSTMPVCAAYRASLLTGKHPTSTGMVINELRMNPNHECIGHVLTRAGYATGWIGKWHLWANELGNHDDPKNAHIPPGPYRLGFDGYWAGYNFHHQYYDAYYYEDTLERKHYRAGAYEPDAQTDMAIGFLKERGVGEDPFALFVSYGTPHDPWNDANVPPEYREIFAGASLPNPPNYKPENDPHADAWGRLSPDDRGRLEHWRRNYYAMTANLDANVGRLLAALDEAGLADSTIVVFTSDHGEMFGAQGRRAKNIFYEEACRVPFLMRWAGRTLEGYVADTCLGTPDIMPTLLGLMGLPIPAGVEGMDLSHRALGGDGPEPPAALLQNTGACAAWEDGHEWRAARSKRYTYATYRVDGSELLFDNQEDPYQTRNLIGDPEHAPTAHALRDFTRSKMADLEDTFEACTWYRDHWTDGNRNIVRGARG